jgi:hypothetical protein
MQIMHFHTTQRTTDPHIAITKDSIILNKVIKLFSYLNKMMLNKKDSYPRATTPNHLLDLKNSSKRLGVKM